MICYLTADPHTLQVNDGDSTVGIEFTPTIPHCSMATLIGLSIKVKLLRSLPDRFKVRIAVLFSASITAAGPSLAWIVA